MSHPTSSLAALCVAGCLTVVPCWAASSAASSASDSIGASVGSVSGSFKNSSTSSAQPDRLAGGEYRVVALATDPQQPDRVTLTLARVAPGDEAPTVELTLPQRAVQGARLTVGDHVAAHTRAYGVEFADARTQVAFYLVLKDDWYEELQSRAVAL